MDLILRNIGQLVTVAAGGRRCKAGPAMAELGILEQAALQIRGDRIAWCGKDRDLPSQGWSHAEEIDARGMVATPGFVDAHTHLVFGGSRDGEFAMRIGGCTYQQIAEQGGGILHTVRSTRACSAEELFQKARRYLEGMRRLGTTTAEVKSGYGLEWDTERKMLEVVRRLSREQPVELVATFLGAHAFPPEYRLRPEEFVQQICEEMLPLVAGLGLAAFCDVFCEHGYFSVDQGREILRHARSLGLAGKVHADELSASGGSRLAAETGAVSADHLEHILPEDRLALRDAGTVAVLLPGVDFFLGHRYADARALIEAGVPVALATDFNPGSCMSYSMPLMMTLACTQMRMTPEEVLTASTLNAAAALGLSDRIGSLEPGKQADILLLDIPHYRFLPYHFGENHVARVIKKGVRQEP